MSLTTADRIFLAVGLLDFGGVIVWWGVCLYMGSTKMELLLDHLKNSPVRNTLIPLIPGSLGGKVAFIAGVSSVVTFPRFFLKRGLINAEDILGIPEQLKRKLVVLQCAALGLLSVMVCLGAVAKFGRT